MQKKVGNTEIICYNGLNRRLFETFVKEVGEVSYQENTVYIFVPFRVNGETALPALHHAILQSGNWVQVQDEIKYMLKYVADKIDGRDVEHSRCIHYTLDEAVYGRVPALARGAVVHTEAHDYGDAKVKFDFEVQQVQLYCFGMGIGILAFKLHFLRNDSMWISSALYYLKKVSREKLYISGEADETGITMLALAKQLMAPVQGEFDFFFYANAGTERANVLTLLEAEEKPEYKKELYYLRRCYNEGFLYTENAQLDAKEIHQPSADVIWGISPEAAACLICPQQGRRDFLCGTFYQNFNAQYLFMYVLLLHQKYMLYLLQTQIGVGMQNDLETLENYRRQLYEFESDFVFSCVTEVEQYQRLYQHMTRAFALKEMFADVREPLNSLSEIRQKEEEQARKKSGKKLNIALTLLSLLGLFSAAPDSWDLAKLVSKALFGGKGAIAILCVFVAIILGVCVLVVKNLFGNADD